MLKVIDRLQKIRTWHDTSIVYFLECDSVIFFIFDGRDAGWLGIKWQDVLSQEDAASAQYKRALLYIYRYYIVI